MKKIIESPEGFTLPHGRLVTMGDADCRPFIYSKEKGILMTAPKRMYHMEMFDMNDVPILRPIRTSWSDELSEYMWDLYASCASESGAAKGVVGRFWMDSDAISIWGPHMKGKDAAAYLRKNSQHFERISEMAGLDDPYIELRSYILQLSALRAAKPVKAVAAKDVQGWEQSIPAKASAFNTMRARLLWKAGLPYDPLAAEENHKMAAGLADKLLAEDVKAKDIISRF